MLKKDFNTIYDKYINWLFVKKDSDCEALAHGARITVEDECIVFISTELITFIHDANKTRNPDKELYLPAGISSNDFSMALSQIKNILL